MGRRRKSSGRSTSESSKDDGVQRFEEEQRDEDVPKSMMTPRFNESGINAQSTPLSGWRYNPAAVFANGEEHETLLAGNLNMSSWMESTRSMFFKDNYDGLPNSGLNRLMLFILVAVCAALTVFYFRPNSAIVSFESNISRFRRSFSLPLEDEELLLYIGSKWLSEDEGDPTEPIILTVAGEKSNAFVTELLNIAAGSIGKRSLKPNIFSSITSRAELHSQVFLSDEKVIAITSVEKMPWDVPLVLHAIADHISQHRIDNILIMLAVAMEIDKTDDVGCDVQIERELSTRWNEAGGDQDNIPPVLSRILSYTICI